MTLMLNTPKKTAKGKGPGRKAEKLEPVEVVADLIAFSEERLAGALTINGEAYFVEAIADDDSRELLGYRLQCKKPGGKYKRHEVNATGELPSCNCEDATYRPERPGGCKHLVALAQCGFVNPIPTGC